MNMGSGDMGGGDMDMDMDDMDMGGMGMMSMSFEAGIQTTVLFSGWMVHTPTQYFFTWVAVFVFGILSVFLKAARAYTVRRSPRAEVGVKKQEPGFCPSFDDIKDNLGGSAFTFLISTIDYALMLITMTFNVGLFFAVVSGLAFGVLIFGSHLKDGFSTSMCCELDIVQEDEQANTDS